MSRGKIGTLTVKAQRQGELMRSSLVIDAREMAWLKRSPNKSTGRIFHSDRGSQYASHEFSQVLQTCGIAASMSRKGNCWDNAPSEALFASLKVERLHGQRFETIRQAKDEILAWLLWYNQPRMHSTLNYVSPVCEAPAPAVGADCPRVVRAAEL
jgi:putative transposase